MAEILTAASTKLAECRVCFQFQPSSSSCCSHDSPAMEFASLHELLRSQLSCSAQQARSQQNRHSYWSAHHSVDQRKSTTFSQQDPAGSVTMTSLLLPSKASSWQCETVWRACLFPLPCLWPGQVKVLRSKHQPEPFLSEAVSDAFLFGDSP